MEVAPGRLIVCARCREQVLLCRRCDRGQQYCGVACSRAARRGSQQQSARVYQRSRRGRMLHAARSRRWRMRQRMAGPAALVACTDNIVTHQGSLDAASDAPLAACTPEPIPPTDPAVWRCRRCGCALPPWVRMGFVRHGPARRWPLRAPDHSP